MKILDKIKLTHLQKALIISIFIELLLIFSLLQIGFKNKPKEQTYAVEFVDDDFKFEDLKPKEKVELPDISKYVNKHYNTNIASNQTQEDKSFEEFRQQQEEAMKNFQKSREEINGGEEIQQEKPKEKPKKKDEKRFTGKSNINYFLKNRRDMYIANPLYTCPDYMTGLIAIDIEVDRQGNVISAKFNKAKSQADYGCLVDRAIEAAYKSYFNSESTAPVVQKGLITYNFY